jgi:hypothetical protein
MSEIDSLRQRIEHAELRLKTAHTARQRESAALMTMWDQIRDRFAAQSVEIVHLRERVSALEDTREALNEMVRSLLGAVENSIERMADETVSEITGLAEALLDSDPSGIAPADPAQSHQPEPAEDEPVAPTVAETGPSEGGNDDLAMLLTSEVDEDVPNLPPPPDAGQIAAAAVADEPASPGIRSLISRIEGAFERKPIIAAPARPEPQEAEAPRDEELNRDLDDIRRLREELQNLRSRIGAGR